MQVAQNNIHIQASCWGCHTKDECKERNEAVEVVGGSLGA
jgi:hypothetical protein